jgi:hypothetical protein
MAHLSHKIIRIFLRTRKAKSTLAGKRYPPQILSTSNADVFTIPPLFLPTTKHLSYYFVIIFSVV